MRYKVSGAKSDTGESVDIVIDAASSEEARSRARAMGIFVSAIDQELGASPKAVPHSNRSGLPVLAPSASALVPEYGGLRWSAFVFRVLAALNLTVAAITIAIGAVIVFQTQPHNGYSSQEGHVFIVTLATATGMLFSAFAMWAISNAISAFRDIARNSWIAAFGRAS